MLFVSSGLLKWQELVQLQTLVVMFKAKSKTLPAKLQKMFVFISEDEDHRRKGHFKHQSVWTTLKQMCISVVGVKLWNSLYKELKDCKNIFQLKKICKDRTMRIYEQLDNFHMRKS